MAWLTRDFLADQPLHVIQRGNNRKAVFYDEDDHAHGVADALVSDHDLYRRLGPNAQARGQEYRGFFSRRSRKNSSTPQVQKDWRPRGSLPSASRYLSSHPPLVEHNARSVEREPAALLANCYRALISLLSASGSLHPSVKSNDCWNRIPFAVEPPAGTVPSI